MHKARQPVFAMMNNVKNLNVPTKSILHLYLTIVKPVLVYGNDNIKAPI